MRWPTAAKQHLADVSQGRQRPEAADYLARTEPHSPTPYLVRRAIAWGSMRLEDLLPELVRNDGELTEICRLLQISHNAGK